jgi:hypothetical protein
MFLPWLLEIKSDGGGYLRSLTAFQPLAMSSEVATVASPSSSSLSVPSAAVVPTPTPPPSPIIVPVIPVKKARKLHPLPQNPPEPSRTKKGRFKSAICDGVEEPARTTLWDELNKIEPESKRTIAEKMLVYLLLNESDRIGFTSAGLIVLNGHILPNSFMHEAFEKLLSDSSEIPEIGEMALLTLLHDCPRTLSDNIAKTKKKWLLLHERSVVRDIQPQDVIAIGKQPVSGSEDVVTQLTPNYMDGSTKRINLDSKQRTPKTAIAKPSPGRTKLERAWYQVL